MMKPSDCKYIILHAPPLPPPPQALFNICKINMVLSVTETVRMSHNRKLPRKTIFLFLFLLLNSYDSPSQLSWTGYVHFCFQIKFLQLFLGSVQHHVPIVYGTFPWYSCILSRLQPLLQSLSWAHITPLETSSTTQVLQQRIHVSNWSTRFYRPTDHLLISFSF